MSKQGQVTKILIKVQILFAAAAFCGLAGFVGSIILRPIAEYLFYKFLEQDIELLWLHPMFWKFDYQVIPFILGAGLFFLLSAWAVFYAQRRAAGFMDKVFGLFYKN